MRINVYMNTCARSGKHVMSKFVDSVHGETISLFETAQLTDCDLAVIWSVLWTKEDRKRIFKHYRGLGIPVLVLEVGALQRNFLWKVGLNGINENALWASPQWDRFSGLGIPTKPWRSNGSHIVVCGQNPLSEEWRLGPMEGYLEHTVRELRRYTDRPIVIRPHPRAPIKPLIVPKGVTVSVPQPTGVGDEFDFPKLLERAWAVVSHNSNPGIQAGLLGVPVFCDASSLAAPIGNLRLSDIEEPQMVERAEWFNRLAFTEFSVDEIASGLPWRLIRPLLT